ncbi:hypothetical protein F183_A14870 [Bryobacterales bacterium F-183]|nr:hypothetical protein F183_A14870 [Bryobacterales bacterium F-183]
MKNQVFHVTNALAVLVLLSASEAASAKVNNKLVVPAVNGVPEQTLLTQDTAKKAFQEIREAAIGAASDAADLKAKVQNPYLTTLGTSECPELMHLKSAINQMGRQVLALEASRANLAPAQIETLDRVLPLLQSVTANLTGAIEYAKEHPTLLAKPENQAYTAKVERSTRQIIGAIDEYLKRR